MYPAIEPYAHGMLDTGEGHQLYWETCGNPEGIPAVFLHGGPGAGSPPEARRLFDPARYNVLLFDQRGAGRSRPHASLDANTTWHLVADIERLRRMIGVERWLVFGGSWGSTLALAYAQTHPERVSGLILRGVFTARREEIDWFYRGGAGWLFPEAWDAFLGLLAKDEQGDPVAAYYRRLTSGDASVQAEAARHWSAWEARTIQLVPSPGLVDAYTADDFAAALARIEAHYMINHAWLGEGQLLANADRLRGIPGVIVQGRYDACTPPRTAWQIHRAWPGSQLIIVPAAGHRFDEPGICNELLRATDGFSAIPDG